MRRHYLGGLYAAYLGQGGREAHLAALAELHGDKDRPGRV